VKVLAQFFVDLYAALAVQYKKSGWLYRVVTRTLRGGYNTIFDLVEEQS
jgi:hypothetical protein